MYLPPLRQLQYLVALHDHLHFGRAAKHLNVTQSTLSTGIRELEKFLGVQLVERTSKQVAFSPLGTRITDRARYIIMQTEDLIDEAKAYHNPLSSPVKIGGIHTIAPFILGRYAVTLREQLPSIQLYLRESTTSVLVEELQSNHLDLALIALPYEAGAVETETLFREPLYLAFHQQTALIQPGETNFDALPDESLLLLDDGHCLRDHALAGCRLKNHKKIHTFGANSLQMLVQMVDSDIGVTILPQMAIDAGILNNTAIDYVPLPINRFYRDIGFAWRRGHSRRPLLTEIIQRIAASGTSGSVAD
jgi:LysR family hydrogen peroxide-inducible transcriptional activator